MKSPTLGLRSVGIEFTLRGVLCTLCSVAGLYACQSNTSATAGDPTSATSEIGSTQPLPTAAAVAGAATLPTAAAVAGAASAATTSAAPDVVTEPRKADEVEAPAGAASAKTPRANAEKESAKPNAPATSVSSAAAPAAAAAATPKDAPAAAAAALDKPCLGKSFEFGAVKAACEKGGVPQAKSLMKSWVKKAKDKGEEYKCTTCHDNQRTYSNKSNAAADLRKLLNVIK
jgi:hypothetical protein